MNIESFDRLVNLGLKWFFVGVLVLAAFAYLFGDSEDDSPVSAYSGVEYSVLNDVGKGRSKRTVTVSLVSRISESDLKALSDVIKSSGESDFSNVFINYKIPDASGRLHPWAVVSYGDDVNVSISGLSYDDERVLRSMAVDVPGEVLGRWLDARAYIGEVVVLHKDAAGVYITLVKKSGYSNTSEVKASEIDAGLRFDYVHSGDFKNYFILNAKGALEYWADTHFYTANLLK